jgi:hypothetical protein
LTVADAWDAERPSLQPMLAPFDGFHETPHAVTGTCLISFDRNRYSVMAKAAGAPCRFAPMPIGSSCASKTRSAEHPRFFGRDRTIYDPWHYCRCWPRSRLAERRTVPGLGSAAGTGAAQAQAGDRR